jgi:hypothetical protein
VGLRPIACWDCRFESRRGHGCLSIVSVVCFQVEVSATSWSLVQSSPTECGVSECDCEASKYEAALTRKGLSSNWKEKHTVQGTAAGQHSIEKWGHVSMSSAVLELRSNLDSILPENFRIFLILSTQMFWSATELAHDPLHITAYLLCKVIYPSPSTCAVETLNNNLRNNHKSTNNIIVTRFFFFCLGHHTDTSTAFL